MSDRPASAGPAPDRTDTDGAASDVTEQGEGVSAVARSRTHPITPLVMGWKVLAGVVAVLFAQNVARLQNDFTVQRALVGLGFLAAVVVVVIIVSALAWWFTTYAVDDDGVSLHKGVISRSREYAPRARIESVSVERPLLARFLGLAKVRVEVAGGGESYLDIQYVKNAEAEELRQHILGVVALAGPAAGAPGAAPQAGTGKERTGAEAGTHPDSSVTAPNSAPRAGALEDVLYDGVTEGELIAKIPTSRLVRSLLRDLGFLIGTVTSILGVVLAISLAIWQEGISIAVLIPLLPTVIAIPKYVFGRIESGWGFLSRITDRGLRMRRGLANTRTDNIAAGRIQRVELRRPLLWRTPDWTSVSVTVAGLEEDDENGAQNVLPVGTREELGSTLAHLAAPLGTADDLATLEQLLTTPAREIEGLRTPCRAFWIARRTSVTVLLPGAVVHRSGLLTRKVQIIPRERVQQLTLEDDPFGRKLGLLDLKVGVAGHTLTLDSLARGEARTLHSTLARDARTLRRYRDQEQWPQTAPVSVGAVASTDPGSAPAVRPEASLENDPAEQEGR